MNLIVHACGSHKGLHSMKSMRLLGSTALLALLAACGGNGLQPLIGADATLIEAETAFGELETRATDIQVAEGDTLFVNLPTGDATYQGIISGGDGAGGVGNVTHYADLSLSTDFDTNDVTGSITNVVTDVVDFENPTGTINVTGSITDGGPNAAINFNGSGALVGTGVEADYVLLSANGGFAGTDGAAIGGNQATDINWTSGLVGGEISDGDWYAERN
jgi:hypothetical protein